MMKLRLLLIFFAIASVAWGQTETITITQTSAGITQNSYNSGAERTWTQEDVDFGAKAVMKQGGQERIQFQAGNGVIYNTSPLPGKIVSISIDQTASNVFNFFGGNTTRLVNSTSGNYDVTGGTQVGSSSSTGWNASNFNETNYTFFAIKKGSGASYVSSITIEYEVATSCEASNIAFTDTTVNKDLLDPSFTQTATSLNATTAITYESSDELVATVNATTGEVSLVGVGTATITATQEAGEHSGVEYCAGTATYELTVISTEPVITVSTNSLSLTAFAGGAATTENITVEGLNLIGDIALALSGDANFSINPNTLSADGGDITITYTPSASPATHSATLTVSNGSLSEVITLSGVTNEMPEEYAGVGTFEKITSTDDLTDGYYVIIEADTNANAMTNNHNGTFLAREAITPTGNTVENPHTGIVWYIETNGDGRTIYNEVTGKYVSYTGSSNNIQVVDAIATNNQRWAITYTDGEFHFNNVSLTTRKLQYNSNSGQERFAAYTGSQKNLLLYKLGEIPTEPVITVSTNSLSLTAFAGGASATEDITINGANLTGNIALSLTGDTNFSIDPNTLSADGGTVTVTYTPSASPATHSANLTVSNGALSEVIALSGVTNEVPAGPCFEGHAPSFPTKSDFTTGGETDSGGDPTTTIRLASSNNGGSVSTTATGVIAGDITVRFRAKGWNASETEVTVQVGSSSVLYTDLTTSFAWHEVTFSDVLANPTLTFSTVSGKRLHLGNVEIICVPSTPTPQITVTPSGNHDFENQLVGSTSTPETFTIANTGNADLTLGTIALSGADAGEFSVTQASSPVTQGNTTTFTVSFSPTSLGSKTATVTIPNNDEDYTFTVTGTGSYAAASDIATNTSYSYTENILYANYQTPTITNTSNSVGVFQFAVRDGGGDNDGDDKPTTLTDIAFNYTGSANTIRAAALFIGNAHIANGVVSANGISFSGLIDIVAPDNGSSPNITLRVSFTETVTDKEKLVFTVASATADASGSVFAQANAGGAFSDNNNGNNRNRIEVVADRLAFATQQSGTSVNTNLAAFVIAGVDQFGNTDADATNSITLTTSGTGMTASPSYTMSNGLASVSDVEFNAVQTGITLTATTTGLVSSNTVTSAPFDISDLATGTYRTTSDGTWPNSGTATWQRLTTGGWTNATPGASATDLLIIRHTITTNAAFGAAGGTKMIVENGGTFNAVHNSTFGALTVQDGGVFSVDTPAVTVTTDGNLTVENGGRLIFNSSTLDSSDGLFRGTENFHPESILEIKNWHFNAGSGSQNLIQSNSTYYVTPNSAGYHFGHIEVNAPSMSSTLGVIQNTLSGSTVNLCNDFRVLTNANRVILVNSGTNTVIGGNLIVNTASSSQFSFAANTASNATHTVKGDIVIESGVVDLNQTSSNNAGNIVVQLQGNLVVNNSGVLQNTDSGDVNTMLNFTGNGTEQTVSTASESTITSIPFNINSGASVKIINHNFKLGNNSKLTVKTGGTLDFGFNGSTALNVAGYGNTGTGFTSEAGSYLKISSPQGIVSTSGSVGNIQTNTAPNISTLGTFHYIGKEDQVTGNGIGASSNGRAVIVEMDTDALVLTPSVSFGITNNANTHINNNNGGILDIRKGRFVETETEYITGSTGSLKMEEGTYYEVVKATEGTSDYVPRISGTYELNGGEINLASTGDQTLRGGKSYFDLTFSQGGEKGISSTIANIAGTVTIKDHTILDVGNTTFGGTPTHLVMEDTAMFIVNGGGAKPNMGGSYTLASGTTIDFTGSSATQIRVAPDYANVIVSGTNISAGTTDAAGLTFQNGGSFTVKDGATFKVNNPAGFTGSTSASIKNAEVLAAITLEPNSTIEYSREGNQTITNLVSGYQNLLISGTGTKTAAPGHLTVNGDLEIQGGTLRIEDSADEAASNVLFTNANLEVSELGELVLGNNAQLMQTNTTVNTGEMSLERIFTLSAERKQYNFVISPVSGQEIKTIYPDAPAPFVIELDESLNWFMDAGQGAYSPGKGYAIKEPTSDVSGDTVRATMKGGFVNGDVNYTLSRTPDTEEEIYGSNLIGNPYPSALDLDSFYAENSSNIGGTAWFWDNRGNVIYDQQGSTYGGSNYAVYNFLNNTGVAASGSSGTSRKPTAHVRPATAFIVEANEGTNGEDLLFTNAMRTTGFGPSFFGKANTTKDRYWLNLKTPAGLNVQTAVVYFPAGNNELWLDDSEARYSSDDFYSLVNDNQLSIQGKASFNVKDRVPLGVRLFADGVYVISIENVEGVFEEGQIIYLRDKKTKMIYNLSEKPYKFGAMAGEYNDRFEILYRKVILDELSATVFGKISLEKVNRNIEVKSTLDKIQKVEVYNLSGRLIFEQNQIQSLEYYLPLEQFGKQIIIVRTVSEKGEVVSKKFIAK